MQYVLELEATAFTKEQIRNQLDMLDARHVSQIALAGRSNVGKSSLINALAHRKQLAKTSSTPGKTRSLNFYTVTPDVFTLVDLPGYGYARCSQEERKHWAKLIEYYLSTSKGLRAFVLLLDCRIPPQAIDHELATCAKSYNLPVVPVLTKIDKCKQAEQKKRQQEWCTLLNGIQPLLVSSKTMKGIETLWDAMQQWLRLPKDICMEPSST